MPRLKQREIPFGAVQRVLRGNGITPTKLAVVLGCSYNTARKKFDCPELLTLHELRQISKRGYVPWDEIRQALLIGNVGKYQD